MANKNQIIKDLIKEFYPYIQKQLGFQKPPSKIILKVDEENAKNPLGKTGYYNPEDFSIVIYTTGRHPKDILRSLAHEIVHHDQNCNGKFDNKTISSENYFQEDDELKECEREAYEKSQFIFREWEESLKEKDMSVKDHIDKRNEKVNDEVMKRFGFVKKKEELKEEDKQETQLEKGKKVEKEHSDTLDKVKKNPNISKEEAETLIAKDHVKEDSKYYDKLAKMEKKK